MRSRLFCRFGIVTLLISLMVGALPSPGAAFEVRGLKTPESFIADPSGSAYFISNINGKPTEKDNNGFITRLDEKGKITNLKWVEGGKEGITLHAPKGMAVIDEVLYVTDIDFVRGFHTRTGELLHDLDLSDHGPKFLNDLTSDGEGNLYVTDMVANRVLRIDTRNQHQITLLSEDDNLRGPNGIVFDAVKGRLVVVTWDSGAVLGVGLDGRVEVLLNSKGLKNLDGVDLDEGGNLYISSFTDGRIYKISPDFRRVKIFREGLTTPADINLDLANRLVLIPFFKADKARTQRLR